MRVTADHLRDVQLALARKSHLRFMQHCWMKDEPMVVGYHTREITTRIDRAIEDYRNGKSSYIRIKIHQRAGKSDVVSRFLPPHFLAEFPDRSVINASYSAGKAEEFSAGAMRVVRSAKFQELYPNVVLGRKAVGRWNFNTEHPLTHDLEERFGQVLASGLTSGITGEGAALAILDDYCGSRADAESPVFRNKSWEEFTDSFMSRLDPVHIVIVLATQWHVDDIHGRIEEKNDPESENYDPEFPHFEVMSFPARRELAPIEIQDNYPGPYLFMERYSEQWYRGQYAQLGTYSASAMMDCDPVPRDGGILNTAGIVYHDSVEDFPKLQYCRVWDYAHSAAGRTGADPDYTGGTLLAFERGPRNPATNQTLWNLWILDYVQFREGAVKRDKLIRETADKDGRLVKILVETSLDSKDGFAYLQKQLGGIFNIKPVYPRGDKVQRCTPVEPIFDSGHVHVLRGPWNKIWETGLKKFDGSGRTHDEMVDNITAGFTHHSHIGASTTRKKVYGRV